MVAISTKAVLSEPVRGLPQAKTAFVLYHDGRDYCSATKHSVANETLGLGRVISLARLSEQLQLASKQDSDAEFLPQSVFMHSSQWLGWMTKSREYPMWFNVGDRRRAFRVWWPNLVWLVNKQQNALQLFAVGSGTIPSSGTRLYHAPLMNIGNSGRLCEGTAQLPNKISISSIPDIEACLFDACFTHVNHNNTIKGRSTDVEHMAFWRKKEKTGGKVMVRELNSYKKLGEIV